MSSAQVAETYPVICGSCRQEMTRQGWDLVCPNRCATTLEWAFGPNRWEPITARLGREQVLIGYIRVPDLQAREAIRRRGGG